MKRTKIVCTMGPASAKPKVVEQMISHGMNVARLNFSHGSYSDHAALIRTIRAAAVKMKHVVGIMQDLQGPRIRVGAVHRDGIELVRKELVVLVPTKFINYKLLTTSQDKIIPIDYPQLYKFCTPGQHVLINDGLIDIVVTHIKDHLIYGTVARAGIVFSHKGINIPGANIIVGVITDKDKEDLAFGLKNGIDFVALSFVKDAKDILQLRKLIGKKPVQIIAKIERKEAVHNFAEILAVTDGVMIARGDLGIEIPAADVPLLQKDMIQQCLRVGKPVIVATQMLESMTINARPTRAEVSDVANAVIDHADAVMLSAESAFGKYPVEAVKMMSKIIKETEASKYDNVPAHYLKLATLTTEDAISVAAYDLAQHDGVKAIVVNSLTGRSARFIARHRPEMLIVALTNHERTRRQLTLTWGVYADIVSTCSTLDQLIQRSIQALKQRHVVKAGQIVVLVTGHPVKQSYGDNMVKLHKV